MRFHPDHLGQDPRRSMPARKLYDTIGREQKLKDMDRLLRLYAQSLRPPAVGAFHLTCSDESERECVDTFLRGFVHSLLPSLKFSERSPFRGANLGGRYEWGAVRIAENHFSLAKGADEWKLLLVKVNSHVGVLDDEDPVQFGFLPRYGVESALCGALDALLAGDGRPFAQDLRRLFISEEVDRLAVLRDESRVPPRLRALFAAVLSARLQARRVMIDIQDSAPDSPTLYVVLPCVTLNRPGHDTELPVGIYHADRRPGERYDEYFGLGDRAEHYSFDEQNGYAVTDRRGMEPREARDHRQLVLEQWRERRGAERADERVLEALEEAEDAPAGSGSGYKKAALLTALGVAMELAPVPAALALFGQGLVHIHHANRAHRLAKQAAGDEIAREMLEGIRERVDAMTPEQAEHVARLLAREYGVS